MDETLSFCLHAWAKVGKSTIGGSGPPPSLIIDAEGSTKFLLMRRKKWDPWREPPPVWDGTWDAAVVTIRKIEDMIKVYEVLMMGQHWFNTIVIDSISEIQRKLKTALRETKSAEGWDLWDMILVQMDAVLRGIRDLQDHQTRPVPVTIFVSETMTNKSGKLVPNMQGKIGTTLPYLFDVIGYMEMVPLTGLDGSIQIDSFTNQVVQGRRIHIVQSPKWEAGERVQMRLGTYIDVPTIDMINNPQPSTLVRDMYFHLFPHMRPQTNGVMAQ